MKGLLCALILAVTAGVYAGALWYAGLAEPWVLALPDAGEQVMVRAHALEQAGLDAQAEAAYREALTKRFEGRQNVTMVLARLGTLLRQRGAHEEALPFLQRAVAGTEGPPEVLAYAPLADLLLDRGELQHAAEVVAQWQAKAAGAVEEANALCAAGRLALAQGREAEAVKVLEKARGMEGGGLAAFWLAQLRTGEAQTALLEEYLLRGGVGEEALTARTMLSEQRAPG